VKDEKPDREEGSGSLGSGSDSTSWSSRTRDRRARRQRAEPPAGGGSRLSTTGSWSGLGIDWGGLGAYTAKAVTAATTALTVRLDHRSSVRGLRAPALASALTPQVGTAQTPPSPARAEQHPARAQHGLPATDFSRAVRSGSRCGCITPELLARRGGWFDQFVRESTGIRRANDRRRRLGLPPGARRQRSHADELSAALEIPYTVTIAPPARPAAYFFVGAARNPTLNDTDLQSCHAGCRGRRPAVSGRNFGESARARAQRVLYGWPDCPRLRLEAESYVPTGGQ